MHPRHVRRVRISVEYYYMLSKACGLNATRRIVDLMSGSVVVSGSDSVVVVVIDHKKQIAARITY